MAEMRQRRAADVGGDVMGQQVASGLSRELEPLDCWLVKQDIERFEALTGIETENSYQVLGARGASTVLGPLLAKESSGFLARMVCGNRRPWTIRVGVPDPIVIVKKPFKFLMPEVSVFDRSGIRLLGTVKRMCRGYPFMRNFLVQDHQGEPVMKITCPFLSFGWNFTLSNMDDEEIGKISKKWAGIMQETFTDADNFGVGFPSNLPFAQKALILGAVFLIDFCFFEDNEVQNGQRSKMMRS